MSETHPILSILQLWPSRKELASDLGLSLVVVHRWHQRESIPPEYDLRLLEAASNRNIPLLWRDLMDARAKGRELSPRRKPSPDQHGHNVATIQVGKT